MKFGLRILRKLKLAGRMNLVTDIVENGKRFRIPLLGNSGYSNVTLPEPWMTSVLSKTQTFFSQPNDVFVDVGTNIGQTLIKLRSVAPTMQYVGFEPNPFCVHYMNELIKANSFSNVRLFPFGISDKSAVLELFFYCDQDLDSSATIVANFRPNEKVYRTSYVPVFPADAVKIEGRIAVLKIDVEGGEREVLRGFASRIESDQPLILTEILPCYTVDNHSRVERQKDIESLLHGLEYDCFRIQRGEGDSFDRLEKLDAIGVHGNIKWSDYLWCPDNKSSSLEKILDVSSLNTTSI